MVAASLSDQRTRALRLASATSAESSGYGIYNKHASNAIPGVIDNATNLDHDMRGNVAAVRRVEVARQTSSVAVRAYVDVLANRAVETRANDLLHATVNTGERMLAEPS